MKTILIAYDGSAGAEAILTELKRADWSAAAKLAEELLDRRTKDLRLAA